MDVPFMFISSDTNLAKVDSHDSVRVVSKELDSIGDLPCACVLHVGKVGSIEQVAANIDDIITAVS